MIEFLLPGWAPRLRFAGGGDPVPQGDDMSSVSVSGVEVSGPLRGALADGYWLMVVG